MAEPALPRSLAITPTYTGPARWPRLLGHIVVGAGFLMVFVGIAVAMVLQIRASLAGALPWMVAMYALLVLVIAVSARYITVWLVRSYRAPSAFALMEQFPEGTQEHAWLLATQFGREHWTRRNRLHWIELARSSGVNTWVDRRAYESLFPFTRTDQPLEPERVARFGQQQESFMGTIFIVVGTWNLATRGIAPGVVWLTMGIAMLSRVILRGGLFTPAVAGQGWVQHGKARWTVNDSVAHIVGRRSALRVMLYGPHGSTRFNYKLKAGRDQEARDFWQRWTHPHPQVQQEAFVD